MVLNINELLQEGIKQVKMAGIEPGNINPEVKINTKSIRQLGLCSDVRGKKGKYDYEIELNEVFTTSDKKITMDVIIHEILHTCENCMNHGKLWKSYADKMNTMFGYNVQRACSYKNMGLETPTPKYIIECQDCGDQTFRYKKSRVVTHVDDYMCRECRGVLKVV